MPCRSKSPTDRLFHCDELDERMRNPVEKRLLLILLEDWCQEKADQGQILFDRSLSSHRGIVRFRTKRLEETLGSDSNHNGPIETDRAVASNSLPTCYEIKVEDSLLEVSLVVEHRKGRGRAKSQKRGPVESWILCKQPYTPNEALEALESFYETDLPFFEKQLVPDIAGTDFHARRLPETDKQLVPNTDLPQEVFIEGAEIRILSNRFERDRKARKRCLAIHGTACAICGFDFGKTYGEQFAGKIEVHHIVPLSTIRKDYEVDPAADLIPVCPNCHLVFHSKPGGEAYTVEEMREFFQPCQTSPLRTSFVQPKTHQV